MVSFCKGCGRFFDEVLTDRCPECGEPLKSVRAPEEVEPEDPMIGKVIDGRFEILARVGRGGMGAVYRAMQTSVEREVALKVIRGEQTPEALKRFMREARTTSALKNVHTVTTYDIAMELLDGEPMDQVLHRTGRLAWDRSLRIVSQIAESLHEAHEKGIVHRDLKPGNIILTTMGDDADFVKVLDFGVAKYAAGESSASGGGAGALTGTGMAVGTPSYMAPEQATGQPVDSRADIYALGVVLYEMLAGHPPFAAESLVALLLKHVHEDAPPLDSLSEPVLSPRSVHALLEGMMVKSRDRRIQSAEAVRKQALRLLEDPDAPPLAPAVGHKTMPGIRSATRPESSSDLGAAQGGPSKPFVTSPQAGSGQASSSSGPEHVSGFGETQIAPSTPGGSGFSSIPAPVVVNTQPETTRAAATSAAARGRRAALLVAFGVGCVALGILFGGDGPAPPARPAGPAAVVKAPPPPTPAPAPAPADKPDPPAEFTLLTTPADAVVTGADGKHLGRTPLTLPSPETVLTVRLERNGYATQTQEIQAGLTGKLTVALRDEPPAVAPAPAAVAVPARAKARRPRKRAKKRSTAKKPDPKPRDDLMSY